MRLLISLVVYYGMFLVCFLLALRVDGVVTHCNGIGQCSEWAPSEHQASADDPSRCLYGQTDASHAEDPEAVRCILPCHGVHNYKCVCVSKEVAAAGIRNERTFLRFAGKLFMCMSWLCFLLVIVAHFVAESAALKWPVQVLLWGIPTLTGLGGFYAYWLGESSSGLSEGSYWYGCANQIVFDLAALTDTGFRAEVPVVLDSQ